jgi:hypothetical protein
MNVWRLELPLPPDATREREALLWDLAGQEDYRLIHPLFLQENGAGAAAGQSADANPFREAGDWLKMLKSAANEQDQNARRTGCYSLPSGCGRAEIRRCQAGSVLPGERLRRMAADQREDGRELLGQEERRPALEVETAHRRSIPWDKLPWTSTPRLLAELKNAVMAMRDERDIRLLRFAELTAAAGAGDCRARSSASPTCAQRWTIAGQSRPGAAAEVWRSGVAATRTAELATPGRSSAPPRRTPTKSAACWRRTFTGKDFDFYRRRAD